MRILITVLIAFTASLTACSFNAAGLPITPDATDGDATIVADGGTDADPTTVTPDAGATDAAPTADAAPCTDASPDAGLDHPVIMCQTQANGILVNLTGPIRSKGLVAPGAVTNPGYYEFGSDGTTWVVPYTDASQWSAPWQGDDVVNAFVLPSTINQFTLYLANADKMGGSWFLNNQWTLASNADNVCQYCDPVAKDKLCIRH